MATIRELITGSLRLLNVVQANEVPTAEDMDISLTSMNAMLDSWSTESLAIFLSTKYNFPTIAGQKEYTLGSGGDWDVPRPMNVNQMIVNYNGALFWDGTKYVLIQNPNILSIPCECLSDSQYAAIAVKDQTAPYPVKFYDNGNYPLRTISVWPVPTTNQPIELWLWQPLADPTTLDDQLIFPKGYERAIRFCLAIELSAEFGKEITQEIAEVATSSKGYLKRLNRRTPIMRNDMGITGSQAGPFNWNYSTTIPN